MFTLIFGAMSHWWWPSICRHWYQYRWCHHLHWVAWLPMPTSIWCRLSSMIRHWSLDNTSLFTLSIRRCLVYYRCRLHVTPIESLSRLPSSISDTLNTSFTSLICHWLSRAFLPVINIDIITIMPLSASSPCHYLAPDINNNSHHFLLGVEFAFIDYWFAHFITLHATPLMPMSSLRHWLITSYQYAIAITGFFFIINVASIMISSLSLPSRLFWLLFATITTGSVTSSLTWLDTLLERLMPLALRHYCHHQCHWPFQWCHHYITVISLLLLSICHFAIQWLILITDLLILASMHWIIILRCHWCHFTPWLITLMPLLIASILPMPHYWYWIRRWLPSFHAHTPRCHVINLFTLQFDQYWRCHQYW